MYDKERFCECERCKVAGKEQFYPPPNRMDELINALDATAESVGIRYRRRNRLSPDAQTVRFNKSQDDATEAIAEWDAFMAEAKARAGGN